MRLGVEGEDVEDQPAAVDDLDVEQALEALLLAGLSSSSATRRSKPGLATWPGASSSALPLPTYQLGSTWRRFCHSAPTTSAPAVVGQRGELGQAVLGGPARVVAGVDGDEERLLDGRREVDRLSGAHGGSRHTRCPPRLPSRTRRSSDAQPVERPPRRVGAGIARRVDDREGRLAPEPGPLALGERSLFGGRRARSPRRASARRRDRPALAVADRRERRQRRVPALAQRPRLLDEAGVELRAGAGRDPPAVLARARRPAAGPGRAPGSRAARAAARRPRSVAISRARTTRRGLRRSVRDASPGASATEPRGERVEAVTLRGRLERRPQTPDRTGSASVSRPAMTARSQNPVPPARIPIPPRAAEVLERAQGVGPEVGHA